MIEDPPLVRIRKDIHRPGAELLTSLAAPTGNVADAMNGSGALHSGIKPLAPPPATIVGPAVTCRNWPGDNLGLFASLDVVQPGDVIVAACEAFTERALAGDLLAGMLKNAGVAALVTDGAMRDVEGIVATGLPVYCAAITPNSPVRNGPADVGFPAVVGGVRIAAGDLIVADAEGAVVVPREQAEDVAQRLPLIREAEADMQKKVDDGLVMPDFIRKVFDSGRVTYE